MMFNNNPCLHAAHFKNDQIVSDLYLFISQYVSVFLHVKIKFLYFSAACSATLALVSLPTANAAGECKYTAAVRDFSTLTALLKHISSS